MRRFSFVFENREKKVPRFLIRQTGDFPRYETMFSFAFTVTMPKRNRRWRLGGNLGRIMRVKRVGGATWEEAMPPLAPSDRSPTATPELNCFATYPEVPSPTPKSSFLAVRFKYVNVVAACSLSFGIACT